MNLWILLITLVIICIIFFIFDFHRFFYIKFHNNETWNYYIQNYINIKKLENCSSKIIISLSCRPENQHNLKYVLLSLLQQTTRVDQIALNIPYETINKTKYNIPKECEDVVNIYRCGTDYTKYNNILPTLYREGEYGTIIISLSEEYIYGKTFIEELLLLSLNNHNYAILFNEGMLVKPEFFKKELIYAKKISSIKNYIKAKTMNFNYLQNYKIYI